MSELGAADARARFSQERDRHPVRADVHHVTGRRLVTSFQALVLGLIQGLTEFLPISSSAHLALAPWFFGWQDPGLAFDVALHFGTLLAVLWFFRKEWAQLIAAVISIVRKRRVETVEEKRVIFLILATIPGAIGGLLLEEKAETVFERRR